MVGGLGPGRCALTILAPLAALLLSLPAFAGDAETDAETCSPIWQEIGLPSIPEDSAEVPVTVCHKAYILGHSTTNRTPDWALEHVTRAIEGRTADPAIASASRRFRTVFWVPATTTTRTAASTEATRRPRMTSRAH